MLGLSNNLISSSYVGFSNTYSLDFDGTNDYVDCGNDSSLDWGSGDGTVACWFKTDDSGTSDIVMNGSYSGGGKNYALLVSAANKIIFGIDDNGGSGAKSVTSGTSVNDDVWRHAVGVRDGNNLRLYIDGVEDAASPTDITGYGDIDISDNL